MLSDPVIIALLGLLSEVVKGWAAVGAATVQAVAWPIFLGIALLTMRDPLARLIDRFKALGFGDFKAELFEQGLQQVETLELKAEVDAPAIIAPVETEGQRSAPAQRSQPPNEPAAAAPPEAVPWRPTRSLRIRTFEEVLEISPLLAIDHSWLAVKTQLNSIRKAYGSNDASDEGLMFSLLAAGIVNKTVFILYKQLSELRANANK